MIKYFIIRRPFVMVRGKKSGYRVQMIEEKRNIIP